MSSRSSTPTEGSSSPERVAVGRIGRAHGIRGEIWVEVLTDVEGRFAPSSELHLRRASAPGSSETVRVASSRPHKGGVLVCFEGVSDRDGAEALSGGWLEVDRERVPEAPPDEYYHFELIGCRATTEDGQELGEVIAVHEGGAGSLLEIGDGERRVTVPFVASYVPRVGIAERRVELSLPPGYLKTCGSGW